MSFRKWFLKRKHVIVSLMSRPFFWMSLENPISGFIDNSH